MSVFLRLNVVIQPNNVNKEENMTELSPLIETLTATFIWHRARVTFMAQFIVALVRVRTVNFTEIASAFCGKAKPESNYRRIQRFFKDFSLVRTQVAATVIQWLPLGEKWLLCLDRTNWQFGSLNINILVLAVAYNGVAIPLLWVLLAVIITAAGFFSWHLFQQHRAWGHFLSELRSERSGDAL